VTLLEATTRLIDTVKEHVHLPDHPDVNRAVKRMEKRLHVLQVRHAYRQKSNRSKAFKDSWSHLCCTGPADISAIIICRNCNSEIFFVDFVENAEWSGNGKFLSLTCPWCRHLMERKK